MISSRKIGDLHPRVAELAHRFVADCAAAGIDVLIYCTYRDRAAQDDLYAQGRTKPGPIVTNARAGESFHNYGLAWDCVPLLRGKPQWDDAATYARMAGIAARLGIEWAGNWRTFRETAHFQYTGGLTIADLKSGKTLAVTA